MEDCTLNCEDLTGNIVMSKCAVPTGSSINKASAELTCRGVTYSAAANGAVTYPYTGNGLVNTSHKLGYLLAGAYNLRLSPFTLKGFGSKESRMIMRNSAKHFRLQAAFNLCPKIYISLCSIISGL